MARPIPRRALAATALAVLACPARAETGEASWIGASLRGQRTASGAAFDPRALTAAHRTLPFGTRARVICLTSGRSIVVTITDRGPWVGGRVIDVSEAAAEALGFRRRGVTRVRITPL
jgi:rare lipoprotein A